LEEKKTRKWRWGVNRWIILALIILGFWWSGVYPPITPTIQLPAEALSATPIIDSPVLGKVYLTNTMVAMVLVDILLVLLILAVQKATKSGDLVPKGITGALEAVIEFMYNLTESTAGKKWGRKIFPYFAAITITVLIVNWMELIPGVDSIGLIHHSEEGNPVQEIAAGSGIFALVKGELAQGQQGYEIVPFVRAVSTDLNFTFALALISVIMTQVMGVRAHGIDYFSKFWNTKTIFSRPFFGLLDWAVGLLELISEISKILSFAFRLFGNIFAGSVMLFVIGSLVPVVAQSIFLGLEFFVGAIQAVVFGMLTMTFMAQATSGHGGHAEAGH